MDLFNKEFKVLDHGFVRVVDTMGDDSSIVMAARVSYGKGTKKSSGESALINYLYRNDHTSPFEMAKITFHIKAPIFIARQWLRHRTANVNEYSARYSEMEDVFYLPDADVISGNDQFNKQARGKELDKQTVLNAREIIDRQNKESYKEYRKLIDSGIARELARTVLNVNVYTEFYWSIDLNNLLKFLKLRSSDHAQYEIRVYAQIIESILEEWVPATHKAYTNNKIVSLGKKGIDILNSRLAGDDEITMTSKTELQDLKRIFPLI